MCIYIYIYIYIYTVYVCVDVYRNDHCNTLNMMTNNTY